MTHGAMMRSGSILTSGWCDRLEGTFQGPEKAHIFGRID